jgi:hypothetical protein
MAAVVIAMLAGAVLFVAYALLARFVLHGPVTGRSLGVSVAHVSGSAPFGPPVCERASSAQWSCSVFQGSGNADYRVRVRSGSSCWHGRLVGDAASASGIPDQISGCVFRWQWRLL